MKLLLLRILAALAKLGARQRSPIRRVLVIKPDALGDALLATPALRALRQGLPDARIAGAVGPWSRVIWAGSPDLDLLHDLPFPGFSRAGGPGGALRPYWLLLRYAALLRRQGYDAALLLRDDHWWGAALIALAGIPRRVGHAHPLCAPFLTDALPYDPAEHVSRQSLAVVEKIAALHAGSVASSVQSSYPLRFAPSPADQAWADRWAAAHLAPGERLVAIHPGASGPTKAWPPERWASLGDALAGRGGLRVVLTGGPAEAPLAAQVAALMRRPPLSVAGATGVGQLAALLGRAALIIGGDTGPLHIAVSQGRPSVHLFGPSDPGRFGPWGDPARNLVLRAGLPCSPCSSFDVCPRHTDPAECMDRIPLAQVLRAADSLLDI
ncbi:glycosyltransferase family 9 protein [Oscillochloris sp. ZM17-4]|nr:glycosyltransferase family 9 protein [Oscillochloris sp. ZM17-4]